MEALSFASANDKPNEEESEESDMNFKIKEEISYIEIDIPPMPCEDDIEDYDNYDVEMENTDQDSKDIQEDENDDVYYENEQYDSDYQNSFEDETELEDVTPKRKYVEINIPSFKPGGLSRLSEISKIRLKHPCKHCPERFPSILALKAHMGIHGNYQCEVCKKRFLQPHYLRAHMSSHNEEKPYQCTKCEESFTHAISLRAHQVVHLNESKTYECDKCNKTFSRITRLNIHKLVHGEERKFICNFCQLSFNNIHDYRVHRVSHSNDRRFECDVCGKKFKRQTILQSHKLCHTGERPFQCDLCPKKYTVVCNLKRHRLSHLAEKPCDECGKTFSTLSDLRRHKYEHLGYNPFQCDVCSKIFTQSCDLRKHLVIHSGVKPYECKVCYRKFTSSSNMHKHKKTLHPDIIEDESEDNTLSETKTEGEILNSSICDVKQNTQKYSSEVKLNLNEVKQKLILNDVSMIKVGIYTPRKKHNETAFQCNVCTKYFVSTSNLNKHKKTMHPQDEPINIPDHLDKDPSNILTVLKMDNS